MGNLCDSQSDPHANPDRLAVEAVEAKGWTPAAENMGLKPALIRVAFRPLDIHFEPDPDSGKLIFDAPLGSFWVHPSPLQHWHPAAADFLLLCVRYP